MKGFPVTDSALAVLLREGAERAAEVPREEIPDALAEVERVRAPLWARMNEPKENGDRALRAEEEAEMLGYATSWLYQRAPDLPFAFRQGGRGWRFSYRGLQAYIADGGREGRRGPAGRAHSNGKGSR